MTKGVKKLAKSGGSQQNWPKAVGKKKHEKVAKSSKVSKSNQKQQKRPEVGKSGKKNSQKVVK